MSRGACISATGIVVLAGTFGMAPRALASCGSEMCVLDLRGPEAGWGRYSLEVAYQHVDQDDVRIGTEPATLGTQAPPAHHNEIQTRTDSWALTGRALLSDRFSVSASIPYMDRLHRHEHEHHPGEFEELVWNYSGFGDLMATGYWTPGGSGDRYSLSLQLGLKAPTGMQNVDEVDGQQPEPPARPSTGSWDGLAGIQVRRSVSTRSLNGLPVPVMYSLGVLGRVNGRGTDDYQVGNEVQVNLAGGWGLSPNVRLLAQVNSRFRAKDDVGNTDGEEENTGGTAVYGTPGLLVGFGRISAYAYYQLRLYENVNGTQITSPGHVMLGTSYSF